jgi:hypothetical protein
MRKSDAPSKVGLELLEMAIKPTSKRHSALEIPASVPVLDYLENTRNGHNWGLKNGGFHVSPFTTEVHV